jgi:hypothetical protein
LCGLLPKNLPSLATSLPANVDDEVLLVDSPFHGLGEAFEGRGLLDVSFDEYEQAKVPVQLEDDSDNAGDDVIMDFLGIISHGSMVVCLREWLRERVGFWKGTIQSTRLLFWFVSCFFL